MKIKVIVFPGTNCDQDVVHLYSRLFRMPVQTIWYREESVGDADLVVLPGGFSFGDYLRCGAMAKVAPIMQDVKRFAEQGGKVLGICNGFQILCESGLLPGVLLKNVQQRFISRFVHIRIEENNSFFTKHLNAGKVITCPVANFEGNYFISPEELRLLEQNRQIVFRYSSSDGRVDPEDLLLNPNGSLHAIAGVSNREGNVVGLMPHPERAAEQKVGFWAGESGRELFTALS